MNVSFCSPRAILHDDARYPDPGLFKPERFLTTDGKLDPAVPHPSEVFGYGRRICAGRYFAHDELFLAIANILATFNIERPKDDSGNVIEDSIEFTGGLTRCADMHSIVHFASPSDQ